jgi:hypothetical protein
VEDFGQMRAFCGPKFKNNHLNLKFKIRGTKNLRIRKSLHEKFDSLFSGDKRRPGQDSTDVPLRPLSLYLGTGSKGNLGLKYSISTIVRSDLVITITK